MRGVVVAAILGITALAGVAQAATTPVVWQGTAFIVGFPTPAAKTACTTNGTAAVGDFYTLVYRPIIAGSTTNPSTSDEGLSFFSSRNGMHYFTAVGVSFATPGNAYGLDLSSHASSDNSGSSSSSPTIPFGLVFKPATIVAKTPSITVTGTLNNFSNLTGCDIKITAALDLRVD